MRLHNNKSFNGLAKQLIEIDQKYSRHNTLGHVASRYRRGNLQFKSDRTFASDVTLQNETK